MNENKLPNGKGIEFFQKRQDSDCSSDSGYSGGKRHEMTPEISAEDVLVKSEMEHHGTINSAFVLPCVAMDSDTDNDYVVKVVRRLDQFVEYDSDEEDEDYC